jgi:hypothetical protein
VSPPQPAAASPRLVWALRVLVVALLGAGIEGAVLVGGVPRSLSGGPALSGLPPAVGQSVQTSFGAIVVQTVVAASGDTRTALTADDPAGVTPRPGDVWVEVSAALTNLTDREQPYGADRFRLRLGRSGVALAPARSSPAETSLLAVSSGHRLLGFVVPALHPDLWLEFHDRGPANPVLLDLGRVGKLPNHQGTGPAHVH